MPDQLSDLQIKIVTVQSDIKNHEKLIDKLSEGITKIQEMSTTLVRMLAVHDERHERHEHVQEELDNDIKQTEDDIEKEIKELHSRITTTTRETQNSIDELKREVNERLDKIMTRLPKEMAAEEHPELKHKLQELEKWKFILMGAFIILLWLADHINWETLGKIFGSH